MELRIYTLTKDLFLTPVLIVSFAISYILNELSTSFNFITVVWI